MKYSVFKKFLILEVVVSLIGVVVNPATGAFLSQNANKSVEGFIIGDDVKGIQR